MKNPRMPRCRQFRKQAWRHSEGRKLAQPWWEEGSHPFLGASSLGHHGRPKRNFSEGGYKVALAHMLYSGRVSRGRTPLGRAQ